MSDGVDPLQRDTTGYKRQVGVDNEGASRNYTHSRTVLPVMIFGDGTRSVFQPIPQQFAISVTVAAVALEYGVVEINALPGMVVYPQVVGSDQNNVRMSLGAPFVLTAPAVGNANCVYPTETRALVRSGTVAAFSTLGVLLLSSRQPVPIPTGLAISGSTVLRFSSRLVNTALTVDLLGYIIDPTKGVDIRGSF